MSDDDILELGDAIKDIHIKNVDKGLKNLSDQALSMLVTQLKPGTLDRTLAEAEQSRRNK
jgi:hypothetical protein